MKMDLNYIKKLIKILDTSSVAELEIVEEGSKIRLSKPKPKVSANYAPVEYFPVQNQNALENQNPRQDSQADEQKSKPLQSENLIEVKSPMVGTFYRAPTPDADAYINIGSTVSPGSVLCIIEAMKLMNEIESETSGKIVKILVENAQPVEYNQPLFLIEKN
ncbi:MAG: acetyl-CoA carboxylase biotin carboxyl carrier protein [bacterium]|nr:acetyl-CoA carboxylase biotin carboxyl carrier protein [bacterium]